VEVLEEVDYENLYMIVPNIIKSEFNLVTEAIEKNISKIKGLITANLGIINVFKNRLNIIGDYKLNILNSESYDFYNRYTDISALSVELNNKEMFSIAKNIKTPMVISIIPLKSKSLSFFSLLAFELLFLTVLFLLLFFFFKGSFPLVIVSPPKLFLRFMKIISIYPSQYIVH